MIIAVIEISLFFVFFAGLVSQVIQPFLRGTPYFPILLKEKKLLRDLELEKQNAVEIALVQDITRQKKINMGNLKDIESLKKETNDNTNRE